MQQLDKRKTIIAWSFYDWANSAFATTVMAGFFPLFFKEYWSAGADATVSTFWLGMANSVGSILVAFMAPVLGAIADRGSNKKKFLMFFAYLGILMTCGMYWVGQGNWPVAAFLYILGAVGFSGSNIFYDSLLTGVASEKKMDKVSAFGFGLGYLGGGVLFALNVWMVLQPATFGFADASAAVQFSFLTVGVWWAVFSIPLFLFVKERENQLVKDDKHSIKAGFRQVIKTFKEIRHLKTIFLFLIAYFLYIDGVDTIVRMAVDYGLSIGFESTDLITALLLVQFVGFPAAIAFGYIGDRLGAKTGIYIALFVYLLIAIGGAFMQSTTEFYILAAVIGLVQGGIQALSRSYFAKIIPIEKSAEYFGFYNMVGKYAAVIGPLLIGVVGLLGRSAGLSSDMASRVSLTSISILFIVGGTLFYFVDEDKAKAEVEALRSTD